MRYDPSEPTLLRRERFETDQGEVTVTVYRGAAVIDFPEGALMVSRLQGELFCEEMP